VVPLHGNLRESSDFILPRDFFFIENPGSRRPSPYGFSCGTIEGGNFTRDFVEQVVTIRRHSLLSTMKDM